MHPADDIRGSASRKLSGKKIVLCVTGSIAAVESVRLARELLRHDAEVIPVMTCAATRILHPDALWFATGKKPIVELSGDTEHVKYCGVTKKSVNLVLISPCTANTISKIAMGIDDTAVTTFVTTAIGSKIPIVVVPAMHGSMYNHGVVQKNIEKCKKEGILFINPFLSEGKAKIARIDETVESIIRLIGKRDLVKKRILVIGGATAQPIDDMRILTNRSSGKTAVALAKNAFERGAAVDLWYGYGLGWFPSYLSVKRFETVDDLLMLVKAKELRKYDGIIVCAAIADYIPEKHKGKIPSGKEKLLLELSPAPKVISKIRKCVPKAVLVGFKVESKKEKAIERAVELLKKNKLDFVIANTLSAFGSTDSEIWIVNKKEKVVYKKGTKDALADAILDVMC